MADRIQQPILLDASFIMNQAREKHRHGYAIWETGSDAPNRFTFERTLVTHPCGDVSGGARGKWETSTAFT